MSDIKNEVEKAINNLLKVSQNISPVSEKEIDLNVLKTQIESFQKDLQDPNKPPEYKEKVKELLAGLQEKYQNILASTKQVTPTATAHVETQAVPPPGEVKIDIGPIVFGQPISREEMEKMLAEDKIDLGVTQKLFETPTGDLTPPSIDATKLVEEIVKPKEVKPAEIKEVAHKSPDVVKNVTTPAKVDPSKLKETTQTHQNIEQSIKDSFKNITDFLQNHAFEAAVLGAGIIGAALIANKMLKKKQEKTTEKGKKVTFLRVKKG
jgi:hypothetical protein